MGNRIEVSDLQQQGWTVSGPTPAADGSESMTISHAFRSAAEGTALLARLGQPVQLSVTAGRGALSSTVGLHGAIDLRGGVDALAGQLPDLPGGTAAALAALARSGGTVPGVSLRVVATLPGKPGGLTGAGTVSGTTVSWDAPMGARTVLGASSRRNDPVAKRWLITAGALAVAFVVVVAAEALLAGRRRLR